MSDYPDYIRADKYRELEDRIRELEAEIGNREAWQASHERDIEFLKLENERLRSRQIPIRWERWLIERKGKLTWDMYDTQEDATKAFPSVRSPIRIWCDEDDELHIERVSDE